MVRTYLLIYLLSYLALPYLTLATVTSLYFHSSWAHEKFSRLILGDLETWIHLKMNTCF